MNKSSKAISEIMIASLTPYFLERADFWFEQNKEKIKRAAKEQIWWKENVIFLEKDLKINLFALMRRLTDLGYEKVQTIGGKGEFSQRGGILDIFPLAAPSAWRLEFSGQKIAVIEPLEIKILKSEKKQQKELAGRTNVQSLLFNLKPGDYLVHLDHGIGLFLGFAEKAGGPAKLAQSRAERGGEIFFETPNEISNDKYFVLEYAKNDRLYVPLSLEEKLSRYIGLEKPIIHRLAGSLWLKTKRQAKESAIKLAEELLKVYALRASSQGFKFQEDDELQKNLEADFPFVETDDQQKAIADVKRDMESEKPMDRLICGDVGFGKTEVALRAAFKAVLSGKQMVILAPTTILADQHFRTFEKRLKKFPVSLELLTRFSKKSEQKKILERIKEGKTDILIGTHRLLSQDVIFKDLGLAVIDEEQRFGVRQKEKFKDWRGNFSLAPDILSLSATPIPRTLNLALAGLREISIISTPPPGRLNVKTFIEPFSEKIVKETIQKELARNGQVYFLFNRVETIALEAEKIKKMVPRARVAFIHGRMPEKNLAKIMNDFRDKKIDVLVATTIIENGLDFPNVNTLVVANAARLGLAQAYQIRGRVGRSTTQAFAYFLYQSNNLTDDARQRLEALKEAEALGSGYQIARRDLEIRGAGNILGREQSGPVNAVGLNLYLQMLSETIEEMRKKND